MKVGIIWHCVYPWDVRMEKIIRALREAGHDVVLVSKGRSDLPKREELDGVRICRVSKTPPVFKRIGAKILGCPLYFNPVWKAQTLAVFREEDVDLVLVRDLPLAGLALHVGRCLGRPVAMDMAENYPAALVAYQNPLYKPFLVGNAWLPKRYELSSVRELDRTFVVVDEQKRRLEALGIDSDRLTVVGNTPERHFFSTDSSDSGDVLEKPASEKSGRSLLYVGKIDPHRGIDLLVEVMPKLLPEFPDLRLVLVGNGTELEKLTARARELNIEQTVEFAGWVPFERVSSYVRDSDVCLIPHRRSEHTETTIPNKIFDYMAFGKPVVSSDCTPLKRVIEEHGVGVTFASGDVSDLERKIRQVLVDSDLVAVRENGERAVRETYNWDVDKKMFLDAIERLSATQSA